MGFRTQLQLHSTRQQPSDLRVLTVRPKARTAGLVVVEKVPVVLPSLPLNEPVVLPLLPPPQPRKLYRDKIPVDNISFMVRLVSWRLAPPH